MKTDRKILFQVAMLVLLCAGSAYAQGPALFFTDLESGPRTGGQNDKGAFVTIYGANFGASQGPSTVTVGGGPVDNCSVWGAAWLWYQKITCQLGAKVKTGNIVVTVGGKASNALPFTVRAGNIFFVDAKKGSDANNGSFGAPWKSVIWAKGTLKPGDIGYLRAGTWSEIDATDGASALVFNATVSGLPGLPRAMVGYPGENPVITCSRAGGSCYTMSNRSGGGAAWWTFAEIDFAGSTGTQYIIDWDNGVGGDGLRFVGNKIHNSFASAVVLQGPMNGSDFIGNDVYHYWALKPNFAGTNERGYGLYYGGYGIQRNINISYNRFLNDQGAVGASTKGIQIYGHTPSDHFIDVTISYNQVLNNCMEAIAAGGSDSGTKTWDSGTLYISNNLIAGNGSCNTVKNLTYSGMQIGDGWGGMQAKIWNNTFYLNAGGTIGGQGAGDIYLYTRDTESFDISNNIFYAQPAGQKYNGFIYEDYVTGTPTLTGKNNVFFSNGNRAAVAPRWTTGTITGDPKFVNPTTNPSASDFRLQAISPAKNVGTPLVAVSHDIAGIARPQESAYDIGAYEFVPPAASSTHE